MFQNLRFEIIDQGREFIPANKRFKAIAPNVRNAFRTRAEAVTWLLNCYRFVASLEGFPAWPIPDFRKVDRVDVDRMGVML